MAEDIMIDAAASLKEARAHLEAQLQAIDAALDALGPENTNGSSALRRGGKVAVGDDKVDAVKLYMTDHRRARQADIQRALDFNSGTVSQALLALERDGEVKRGRKENRSYVWELLD